MTNKWTTSGTNNHKTTYVLTKERRTKMLEQRWIAIRDRQARLLAEAEAHRLARRAGEARTNDGSAPAGVRVLAHREATATVGQRLAAVGAGLSTDARLTPSDCPEA
jgi:hypothetical protein